MQNAIEQAKKLNVSISVISIDSDLSNLRPLAYHTGGNFTVVNNKSLEDTLFNYSILGTTRNDEIYGNNASNIINGGKGNDILHGMGGKDLYIFDGDFGDDTIYEITENDNENSVNIENLSASTLRFSKNQDDLLILINSLQNSKNKIVIKDEFKGNKISTINIDHNTFDVTNLKMDLNSGKDFLKIYNKNNFSNLLETKSQIIQGSDEANTLYGTSSNDEIHAMKSNDLIVGSWGLRR